MHVYLRNKNITLEQTTSGVGSRPSSTASVGSRPCSKEGAVKIAARFDPPRAERGDVPSAKLIVSNVSTKSISSFVCETPFGSRTVDLFQAGDEVWIDAPDVSPRFLGIQNYSGRWSGRDDGVLVGGALGFSFEVVFAL